MLKQEISNIGKRIAELEGKEDEILDSFVIRLYGCDFSVSSLFTFLYDSLIFSSLTWASSNGLLHHVVTLAQHLACSHLILGPLKTHN